MIGFLRHCRWLTKILPRNDVAHSLFVAVGAGWLLLLAPITEASIYDYPFAIEPRKDKNGFSLYAANKGPATLSIHASIAGGNFASDSQWPITVAVPPGSTIKLAKLVPQDKQRPIDFKIKTSRAYGDVTRPPDASARYRLPFADGLSFPIGQAPGGHISTHTEIYNAHAVDFVMPEGTPIVAARDGVVIEAQIGYSEGGARQDLLAKANRIVIMHADGTMAQYAHLAQRPPIVFVGAHVTEGQQIGWSGNTGYSSGPHTHFAVTRAKVSAEGEVFEESIPIAFYAHKPAISFAASEGMIASANYSSPIPESVEGASIINRTPSNITLASGAISSGIERARHTAEMTGILVFHTSHPWWIWGVSGTLGLLTVFLLARLRTQNK